MGKLTTLPTVTTLPTTLASDTTEYFPLGILTTTALSDARGVMLMLSPLLRLNLTQRLKLTITLMDTTLPTTPASDTTEYFPLGIPTTTTLSDARGVRLRPIPRLVLTTTMATTDHTTTGPTTVMDMFGENRRDEKDVDDTPASNRLNQN